MVLRANPGNLRVVQVAEIIAKGCAVLAKSFRGPGALARADQLVRASTSICLNIVEGSGRGTVPDFRRFLLRLGVQPRKRSPYCGLLFRLRSNDQPCALSKAVRYLSSKC